LNGNSKQWAHAMTAAMLICRDLIALGAQTPPRQANGRSLQWRK
jgi:hypothetical protein